MILETKKKVDAAEPSKEPSKESANDQDSGCSRHEGQKTITKSYLANWDVIFGRKR